MSSQAPEATSDSEELSFAAEHARRYVERGHRVVLLHHPNGDGCSCGNRNNTCPSPSGKDSTGKHPRLSGWQNTLIVDAAQAAEAWGKFPTANIGLCPRENEVVLDIDPRHDGDATFAKLVADCGELIGPCANTGGGGRHYWLKLPRDIEVDAATRFINRKLKEYGPGVDLRTCKNQVVVEPSVHKSGRRYRWLPGRSILECEPVVPSDRWLAALGMHDEAHSTAKEKTTQTRCVDDDLARARWGLLDARLLNPDLGYPYWFRIGAALKCFGDEGLLLWIEASRTSKDFNEAEIRGKWSGITGSSVASLFGMFDDADAKWRERFRQSTHPGATGTSQAAAADTDSPRLGERDPTTGRLVLCPKKTMPTAEAFIREFHAHSDGRTFHTYGGSNWVWRDGCYRQREDGAVRHVLQPWLHAAVRIVLNSKGGIELVPFDSNPTTVNHALVSIQTLTHLPEDTRVPSWLGARRDDVEPRDLLAGRSSMLHIPTGSVLQPTPALFNLTALDFDYDPAAPEPKRWLSFLHEILGDDTQSIDLLQDWFGYCLTPDTRQQKILLVVGPKRSGKGTIARVLRELVGVGNTASPTVGSLAGTFGLQPLLGKSLAVVSDARFTGDRIGMVVERLLCISGEDDITVDVKFKASVTVKLPVRFMFLTNELPAFNDASTALAGRFVVLQLTRSFYGKEDINLTSELLTELPGILLWAIHGWHRLRERGHFVVPESSKAAIQGIEDLSSPVGAFVRERCVVGHPHRVLCGDLYSAWCEWSTDEGSTTHTTKTAFGRDLASVVPGLRCRRGTGQVRFYEGIGLKTGREP